MARPLFSVTLPDVRFCKEDIDRLLDNPAFLHICQIALERESKYLDLISSPELAADRRVYFCGKRAGLTEFIEDYLLVISQQATTSPSLDKVRTNDVDLSAKDVRKYIMTLAGIDHHGAEDDGGGGSSGG